MRDLRIPAVRYIWMSTEKQEDSPARQWGEIRVGREMCSQGRVMLNRTYGTLTFHPELWSEGPISFDDWDLRPDAHYLKVANYVQAAGRDVPPKELTDVIGLYNTTVRDHAPAVRAGRTD